MSGRHAAVAYGSLLAICSAPVGAAETYADLKWTIEVTGQHTTRTNDGTVDDTHKQRVFNGHARVRYAGPGEPAVPQKAVAMPVPKLPTSGLGGIDIARVMECQQKKNSAEMQTCLVSAMPNSPGGQIVKRCMAKSEAERKKDPMCGGGGAGAGSGTVKVSSGTAYTEVWESSECEGNLVVNDTGSQHVRYDTAGGGPHDAPQSWKGSWSGSTKSNPVLAGAECRAVVIVNPVTGKVDLQLGIGPSRIPVIHTLGNSKFEERLSPITDWSTAPVNGGAMQIKNVARSGSSRQFSGTWTKSDGVPPYLTGKQRTVSPDNQFNTTTKVRWTYAAQ